MDAYAKTVEKAARDLQITINNDDVFPRASEFITVSDVPDVVELALFGKEPTVRAKALHSLCILWRTITTEDPSYEIVGSHVSEKLGLSDAFADVTGMQNLVPGIGASWLTSVYASYLSLILSKVHADR